MNDVVEKLFDALDAVEDMGQKKKFADRLVQLAQNIIGQAQGE